MTRQEISICDPLDNRISYTNTDYERVGDYLIPTLEEHYCSGDEIGYDSNKHYIIETHFERYGENNTNYRISYKDVLGSGNSTKEKWIYIYDEYNNVEIAKEEYIDSINDYFRYALYIAENDMPGRIKARYVASSDYSYIEKEYSYSYNSNAQLTSLAYFVKDADGNYILDECILEQYYYQYGDSTNYYSKIIYKYFDNINDFRMVEELRYSYLQDGEYSIDTILSIKYVSSDNKESVKHYFKTGENSYDIYNIDSEKIDADEYYNHMPSFEKESTPGIGNCEDFMERIDVLNGHKLD